MKVALIGATGAAGSRILKELVGRGHRVLALCRHPENVPRQNGVVAKSVDANEPEVLAAMLAGNDAAISSVTFVDFNGRALIRAVRGAGIRRYLVVGGAGTLEVAPGQLEMNSARFPPNVKPEAQKGAEYLQLLLGSDLDWTFLSPSRFFNAGERTGKFRLGKDQLLVDMQGKSSISYEDYAVALVDELEKPRHVRARFTVGY